MSLILEQSYKMKKQIVDSLYTHDNIPSIRFVL